MLLSYFFKNNLSINALQKRLDKAMKKAFVKKYVALISVTDQSDPYADYTGIRVMTSNTMILARTLAYLSAILPPMINEYRNMTGGQHALYNVDSKSGVILFSRWSRGE